MFGEAGIFEFALVAVEELESFFDGFISYSGLVFKFWCYRAIAESRQ